MAVKTKKRLAYEEKEYEEKVEVTYEESEIRLIVLLLIFATCFLTLSTAFLLIANRLFGLYKESKIVHFTPEKRIGFPVPRKLFIAPNGKLLVYDFVENSFGELKNLQKLPSKDTETKFAFEFDGNIYFISTDKNKNVVQYNIKQRNHRELKNTKIPEPDNVDHLEISLNYGFQIGPMFWIVQGEIDSRFHFKNEVEFDGSAWIWWIRKKKWFKAQQIKGDVNPCFIQISKYQVLILHNFGLIEYTFVNGSISYIETEIESIDLKFFKSCALFFEKNYQRLIIAMGFSDNFFLFQNAYLYNYDANSWKQLDFLANQASNMPIFALFNEIYQILIDDFSSISLFKYDQYFKNRTKVAKIDDFYGNFSKYKSFSAFDYHERHFV